MLPPGDDTGTRFGAMKLRWIIPTDMTASALAHLSLLALVFLASEVHPFGVVTAEPIAVDLVAPQEITEPVAPEKAVAEKAPEPVVIPPPPQPPLDNNAASAPAPAAKPAPPQKQAALSAARPAVQAQPPPPPPPPAAAAPAYTPPQPDITVKYNVLLGLPPDMMAAPAQSGEKGNDNFDAASDKSADVSSSVVAEFRRHLRTCSKLPASLKDSDDVKIKLRVMMTTQGKLAAEPMLIEASASAKGPLLMQGAIKALQACQPYAMLPLDRYGEWKVLDLSFTPRDFSSS